MENFQTGQTGLLPFPQTLCVSPHVHLGRSRAEPQAGARALELWEDTQLKLA